MPLVYERDDHRHRITITAQGAVAESDFAAALERQRNEGTRAYGLLYDLRRTNFAPTTARMKEAVDTWEILKPPSSRGPIAIIATDPIVYSRACTYAALAAPALTVEVFQDVRDADAWLTTATNRRADEFLH